MLWARFNQHRTKLKLSHEVLVWRLDGNVNYFLGCDIRTDRHDLDMLYLLFTFLANTSDPSALKNKLLVIFQGENADFTKLCFFCDMKKYVLTVRPTALLPSGSGLMYCSGRDVYSHQLWRYVLQRRCLIMQIICCWWFNHQRFCITWVVVASGRPQVTMDSRGQHRQTR
jgi:hypothetical protein